MIFLLPSLGLFVGIFCRIQAVAIGQALIDADCLEPVLNLTTPFRDDFTLYKPSDVSISLKLTFHSAFWQNSSRRHLEILGQTEQLLVLFLMVKLSFT